MRNTSARRITFVLATLALLVAVPAMAAGPFQFHPLTPCRLNGGTLTTIVHNTVAKFTVQGNCGVPTTAKAITFNATAISPQGAGYFTIYPADAIRPVVSTLNYAGGEAAIANGAIVPLALPGAGIPPDLKVYAFCGSGTKTVGAYLDITGYFE